MTTNDAQRQKIEDEARRLASSGKYATWKEVREALATDSSAPEAVREAFAQDSAFRDEIAALASSAHGVGGPATE